MFFKFSIFIIAIAISGILTIITFIFGVIHLANAKKGMVYWFIGFAISLSLLIYSISTFALKVQNKIKHFGNNLEQSFQNELSKSDSTLKKQYHLPQSNNQLLDTLKTYSSKNDADVPTAFYSYLGFRDYYRLPLTYPFSIHCIDDLKEGHLYNEKLVSQFDQNDNGETALGLTNITAFTFDDSFLLAELNGKRKVFVIYELKTDWQTICTSSENCLATAVKLGFKGRKEWYSCQTYYDLLKR